MRFIEIQALPNGAHRNFQTDNFTILDGWAVIPDDMETPNFPFGDIEVEKINGIMTVTKWIAGTIPKIEETEQPPSEVEQLRADIDYIAIMTGVEL